MGRHRQVLKRHVIVDDNEVRVKRPLVGVWLGYPLYDEVTAAMRKEPRLSKAAFVMELVRCGWRLYQREPSLKALKAQGEDAPALRVTSKRISAERCAMLAEALNLILERGDSAIIEAVERYLIDKAGKYGGPQK